MPRKMLFELTVSMDGQDDYTIVADQRDVARWEVQSFGWPIVKMEDNLSMSFFRFIAWSASVRTQRTAEGWDDWNARCAEVMPLEDEEKSELPADAEDPGQTAL